MWRDARLVAFGDTVRRVRRERDLSQEAVGLAVGLAKAHVSEIERANLDVRLTTLLRLAEGLGVGPGELLARCFGEQPSSPTTGQFERTTNGLTSRPTNDHMCRTSTERLEPR